MNIKETIANISRMKWELETALEENGGELTPELLEKANALEDLKTLLADGGIDELGRWLKSVQDETAALKAEADAAARRVKNNKSYEDYVKFLIGEALDALELPTNKNGEKVIKGQYYGFSRKTSTKSKLNTEALDEAFLEHITEAARNAGLPGYVDVALVTNVTRIKEYAEANKGYLEEDENPLVFVEETSTPSLGFTKPRASKEA